METILTDANFEAEVLKSDVPVLVDFWAPWCGPCKIYSPVIEGIAEDMKGQKVKIAKMNVDENQAAANTYGVMSIPTTMFFKGGAPVEQFVGVQAKEKIIEKLKSLM